MEALIIWFGYCLLAVGVLLLSPLRDLLPVDLLPLLHRIVTGETTHSPFLFVPSDGRVDPLIWVGLAIAALGLACIAVGYYIRAQQ